MSVRVAVFGTSRSGKDYTIRDATELLAEKGMLFTHISPISLVHEELDGRKLRDMSDREKKEIVDKVRVRMDNLLKDDYVFSDEHYCFPRTFGGRVLRNGYYDEKLPYHNEKGIGNRIYEVVFDKNWLKKYDLAIYLEIDPHIIIDRFRTSEGVKNNPFATYDDIRSWQMFEIEGVQKMCHEFSIPLYYAYDPDKSGEEFEVIISEYLKSKESKTKTIIAE